MKHGVLLVFAPTHADGGPQPVRRSTSPWFLHDSSLRELVQVQVVNELLCFWIRLALVCIRCGTAWLTEHPGEPYAIAEAASIWIQAIMHLDGVRHVDILQGHYGADCAKPTGLLAFALPSMHECLARWRVHDLCRKPWKPLVGKNADGHWETMRAKAYPSPLNGCIMEMFFQRAVQLQVHVRQGPVPAFEAFLPVITSISTAKRTSSQQMGYDFAG